MKDKLKPKFKVAEAFLKSETVETSAILDHLDELKEARDSADILEIKKLLKRY